MLESLKKIFQKTEGSGNFDELEDLKLLSGLMIEAANTDGVITQEELDKISYILIDIFKQDSIAVEKVLKENLLNKEEPKSLHFFTSRINKTFSNEKKLLLIETLWEIILSDGEIHDFESNLIRRLAGLLYVSDVKCANAKNKALTKINNQGKNS